ncbi:hypothetical protein ACOSQ2_003596 [Xanthoceras sorbifolium]
MAFVVEGVCQCQKLPTDGGSVFLCGNCRSVVSLDSYFKRCDIFDVYYESWSRGRATTTYGLLDPSVALAGFAKMSTTEETLSYGVRVRKIRHLKKLKEF